MKKKRKKSKIYAFLVIIILLALAGILVYMCFKPKEKEVKEVKVLSQIDEYGYQLKDNKSKTYHDMFKELEDILKGEVDEEEYAKKIAQMFIYDFYTLSDKDAKTDIGGVDFVYEGVLENFLQNAQNTYYKYVESNIYDNRDQKLPTVKDIEIMSVEQKPFAYNDKTDDNSYFIKATWDYTDTAFATYQKSATLVFIHDGKKLYLVELQ